MGRIRTIKPEFFQHSGLFDAEIETGLPLRLAFAGLWTCCDREGRFRWRIRELKVAILPYDECDFSRVLDALATRGFLVRYAIGTEIYGAIPSWKQHQFINNREPQSDIPPQTSQNQTVDASSTRGSRETSAIDSRGERDADATATDVVKEGKGRERERKGREGNERDLDVFPSRPVTPEASDGSELAAANWLCQEANLPLSVGARQQVALSLRCLANEGGTMETASQFMLQAVIAAKERGEKINRFWFEEEKYKPHSAANGSIPPQPSQAGYDHAAEVHAAEELRAYEMWLGMGEAFKKSNPMAAPAGWTEAKPA